MKTRITAQVLSNLPAKDKPYRIHDTKQPGLFIRVLPSGHAAYMVTWSRNKAATLGQVGKLTLDQARAETAQYLSEAHQHGEPLAVSQGRKRASVTTLRHFLEDTYFPWFAAHYKSYDKTRHAIEHSFSSLLDRRLDEIVLRDFESLRVSWLTAGLSESSANRKMASLRGALSRAVEWEYLSVHPMTKLKQLQTDTKSRIRYLSADEEGRLRGALDQRQEDIRAERDSANQWRKERKKSLLPDARRVSFVDHLKPLTLLSLNTGMRRGEVFNLTWANVDLLHKVLTVEGGTAKSGQTRHIPLNKEAVQTLQQWKLQAGESSLVFPSHTGGRLDNVKKSWSGLLIRAKIVGFRWHDLRHTFASKLVMAGVPLNTVRELLGHADLKMTLRYAHLAHGSKAKAVELI